MRRDINSIIVMRWKETAPAATRAAGRRSHAETCRRIPDMSQSDHATPCHRHLAAIPGMPVSAERQAGGSAADVADHLQAHSVT